MISEKDLQEAIAECQGERHPTANTCIKLAAFYTIRENLYPEKAQPSRAAPAYSFAAPEEPEDATVRYRSETEFSRTIYGRPPEDLWPMIDELVTAVQVLMPRLYRSFIEKLQ